MCGVIDIVSGEYGVDDVCGGCATVRIDAGRTVCIAGNSGVHQIERTFCHHNGAAVFPHIGVCICSDGGVEDLHICTTGNIDRCRTFKHCAIRKIAAIVAVVVVDVRVADRYITFLDADRTGNSAAVSRIDFHAIQNHRGIRTAEFDRTAVISRDPVMERGVLQQCFTGRHDQRSDRGCGFRYAVCDFAVGDSEFSGGIDNAASCGDTTAEIHQIRRNCTCLVRIQDRSGCSIVVGPGAAAFQHHAGESDNRAADIENTMGGNCTVRDRRIKLGLHIYCGEGGKIRVDGFQVIVHGICHFHRDFSGAVNGQTRSETGDLEFIRKCDGRDAVRKGDHVAGTVIGGDQTVFCIINRFTQRDIPVKRVQCIVGCRDLKGRCFRFQSVCTGIEREHGLDAAHCIPVGIFVLRCGEDFAPGQTVCCGIGGIKCNRHRAVHCGDPLVVGSVKIVVGVDVIGSGSADERTGNGGSAGIRDRQCAVCARCGCRRSENFFHSCHSRIDVRRIRDRLVFSILSAFHNGAVKSIDQECFTFARKVVIDVTVLSGTVVLDLLIAHNNGVDDHFGRVFVRHKHSTAAVGRVVHNGGVCDRDKRKSDRGGTTGRISMIGGKGCVIDVCSCPGSIHRSPFLAGRVLCKNTVVYIQHGVGVIINGTAISVRMVCGECTVADIGFCSFTIVADGTTAAGAAFFAGDHCTGTVVFCKDAVPDRQRTCRMIDGTAAARSIVLPENGIHNGQFCVGIEINSTAAAVSVRILYGQPRKGHIHIVAGEFQNTVPVGSVSDLARGRIGGDCVAAVQNDVARTVVIQIAVDGDGGRCGDGDGFRDIDHITNIGPVKVRTVEDDEIIVGSIRCRRHCICEGGELVVCSIGSFRNGECYRFQRVRVILRGEGGFFDQSGPVFQIPVTVCSGGVGGCGDICAGEIGNVPDEGASFCIGSRVAAVDENIRIQRQVFPDPFPVCGIE